MPNNCPLPSFYACQNKLKTRQETIISKYQHLFHKTLPKNKQYWTMCSMQTDEHGIFQQGSELGQVLASNLIQENQFYGVDLNSAYIENNRKAKPDANWFCNDFYKEMYDWAANGKWNPGIIYADLISLKDKAKNRLTEIIELINACGIMDVMLVLNFMANNPHSREQVSIDDCGRIHEEFIVGLNADIGFTKNWIEGWNFSDEYYIYSGTGKKSNTKMITDIFWRKL